MEELVHDVDDGIHYIGQIMKGLQNWVDHPRKKFVLGQPKNESVCARAISKILDTDILFGNYGYFWIYAFRMTAAKQFEYALRGIDDSCKETLKILLASLDEETPSTLNFYDHLQKSEIVSSEHNKYVLGKIGRALFAYKTLAIVIS